MLKKCPSRILNFLSQDDDDYEVEGYVVRVWERDVLMDDDTMNVRMRVSTLLLDHVSSLVSAHRISADLTSQLPLRLPVRFQKWQTLPKQHSNSQHRHSP